VTAPAAPAPQQPSALDDTALFGHPRGLALLSTTEMWERFSYYGMRAILILFLTESLHWSTKDAAKLYGNYTALVYLTPLIGGYLADRWIGTRRSLVIGGLIIATGHFCLAFSSMTMFYIGLGLVIIGTGFFKPNVSTMVGQIYKPGDERRDAGFTLFYIGINVGAVLGQTVCGYFGDPVRWGEGGWHIGFAAAGFGMVAGLILYLWGRDTYLPGIGLGTAAMRAKAAIGSAAVSAADAAKSADSSTLVHGVGGAVVGGVLAWFLGGVSFPIQLDDLVPLAFGTIIGASVAISVLGTHGDERKRVFALFIVAFFVTAFWASYEQAGSSMNLFAARNTDLMVGSFRIAPAWMQNVNAASIVIFAPVFAWLWVSLAKRGKEPSTPLKMVIGLTLLGFGFLFMVAGGRRADTGILVSPLWLTGAYILHTWGELCLSPVGLSYVTKVAPVRFASLLMGVWFLANAAANKVAGWFAGYTPSPGEAPAAIETGFGGYIQHLSATNAGFWMIFVVIGFGAAGAMLLCVPLLNRLTASVKA
jgi:POT family proton-dependent oligopeptide transporter